MKNVQIKNKIIILSTLLIFSIINIHADELYNKLILNNSSYFHINIDINKDGILDKVISSKPYEGDELYFFEKQNDTYNLVFKGENFSEDGGNIISEIKPSNSENYSLRIITSFPDRGYSHVNYFIKYKNNTWYLDKVLHSVGYRFDYDKRLDTCIRYPNIKLIDINSWEPFGLPDENERDLKCTINFEIRGSVSDFINRVKNDAKDKYLTTQMYKALLNKYPLSKKNLTKYNNIAYYLEKAGAYKESIYLLEKIIEKYSNRTVAYINLGDSYLKDGNKEKAIKNYKIYVEQMKEKNKEKKIPERVLKEIDTWESKTIPKTKENSTKIESIKKEEKTFFTKLLELFGSSIVNNNIMQS